MKSLNNSNNNSVLNITNYLDQSKIAATQNQVQQQIIIQAPDNILEQKQEAPIKNEEIAVQIQEPILQQQVVNQNNEQQVSEQVNLINLSVQQQQAQKKHAKMQTATNVKELVNQNNNNQYVSVLALYDDNMKEKYTKAFELAQQKQQVVQEQSEKQSPFFKQKIEPEQIQMNEQQNVSKLELKYSKPFQLNLQQDLSEDNNRYTQQIQQKEDSLFQQQDSQNKYIQALNEVVEQQNLHLQQFQWFQNNNDEQIHQQISIIPPELKQQEEQKKPVKMRTQTVSEFPAFELNSQIKQAAQKKLNIQVKLLEVKNDQLLHKQEDSELLQKQVEVSNIENTLSQLVKEIDAQKQSASKAPSYSYIKKQQEQPQNMQVLLQTLADQLKQDVIESPLMKPKAPSKPSGFKLFCCSANNSPKKLKAENDLQKQQIKTKWNEHLDFTKAIVNKQKFGGDQIMQAESIIKGLMNDDIGQHTVSKIDEGFKQLLGDQNEDNA